MKFMKLGVMFIVSTKENRMSNEQMELFKRQAQYEQLEEFVKKGYVVIPLTKEQVEDLTAEQRASLPLLIVGDDVFHIQRGERSGNGDNS